ncbi:hypothetical protein [Actinoallomurus sp. CA-150999]|uniref:hypothetical protein n=1 Tax=Actinoallomurus sp. CA-150999 TaxID=3239887 RepID=UPI003D93BC1F
MEPDLSKYRLEGDDSMYRLPSGLVAPVVTRGGSENVDTADSGGAIRVSGVSIQHTPATRLWFGKVSNECSVSRTDPLVWMTTRTPENIVVNLPDVADADLRDRLDR